MLHVLFLLFFLFTQMPLYSSSGPKQSSIAQHAIQKAEQDIDEIIGLAHNEHILPSSNPLLKQVINGKDELKYLSAHDIKDSLFALAHSLKSMLEATEPKGPLHAKLLKVLNHKR